MLLLKIWLLTVIIYVVWTFLMKKYYKYNKKAAFNLIVNPKRWFLVLHVLLTLWNVIGLFLILIYFLFLFHTK